MEDLKTVSFSVNLTDFEKINPDFLKAKCHVFYTGKNQNQSFISEKALESAIPTIFNIPVVGHWREKTDGFGGHDSEIIINDEGIQYKELTKPYGLVPESANPRFEDVDGKSYFTVDVILWVGRYDELNTIQDSTFKQSMELKVNKGSWMDLEEEIDGKKLTQEVFNIEDFSFSALCILQAVDPCFEESKIIPYSINKDQFKSDFAELMEEIKASFSQADTTPSEGGDNEVSVPSPIVFELSHDDIRAKLYDLLNPNRDEDGYRIWDYWIMEVFDTHVIVSDEHQADTYWNFPYSIDENEELSLGEKEPAYLMFLNQAEKDALEEMRNNYSVLEAKVQELTEYKESKEQAEYEAQQAKERQEKIDYINTEYESVPEEIRNEFIDKVDEYASNEAIDADMCIYIVKNKLSFSKTNTDTSLKVNIDPKQQEIKFSPYGELTDKFSK